eukprot:4898639-Amphidinium_carterae.1
METPKNGKRAFLKKNLYFRCFFSSLSLIGKDRLDELKVGDATLYSAVDVRAWPIILQRQQCGKTSAA